MQYINTLPEHVRKAELSDLFNDHDFAPVLKHGINFWVQVKPDMYTAERITNADTNERMLFSDCKMNKVFVPALLPINVY